MTLHGVVLEVTVAAVDLDRLRTNPFRQFRGIQLGLRRFGKAREALAAHPRGVQNEHARGVEARMHVGEHVAHALMLDPLFAVGESRFKRGARNAERLGGDADTPAFKVGKRNGEALAARPEQMVFWYG